MRRFRICAAMAMLALTITAFASPLFGTWKLELNGQPVTVIVSYADRRVEGKMIVGSGAAVRELPMVNARIMDRPPSTLRFAVENLNGPGTTSFELHTVDTDNATLQQIGERAQPVQVKAVKQK